MRGTRVHQEIGCGAPPRGQSHPDDDVTHACLGSTPWRLSEVRTMAHRLPAIHMTPRRTRGQVHPLASPPRPFHNPPMSLVNDITSFAATAVRLGRGAFPRVTAARRPDPPKLLELYDFEGCPYCRKVREVLSELDLDYLEHPVARGSPRRAELVKRGGKMQAPYLVDPNTGTELYESDDIIRYLNATYGDGEQAGWRLPVPAILDDVNSTLASAVRFGRGSRCRRAGLRETFEPLTLFNMEGS